MKILHKAYWWLRRRTNRLCRVGELDFVFIDADGNQPGILLAETLRKALETVSSAKAGFGELVLSHLRFVAAKNVGGSFAMPEVRGFLTSFSSPEGDNPRYLAARLVWASTYIRLWRDASYSRRSVNLGLIRAAAHEAQIRFLRQLPDSEELIDYLERHNEAIDPL